MISLSDFLLSAPKPFLLQFHRRRSPSDGLLQASFLSESVQAWAADPARIQASLKALDPAALQILGLLYAAGDRGLRESELPNLLGGSEKAALDKLQAVLARFESELLAYRRKDAEYSYHGFREIRDLFLPGFLRDFLAPQPEKAEEGLLSHHRFLLAHAAHLLSRIALGNVKMTLVGELYRKDEQAFADRMTSLHGLSPSAAMEEMNLLFRFFADEEFLVQEEGRCLLSAEGLGFCRLTSEKALARILTWWNAKRQKGIASFLTALLPFEGLSLPLGRFVELTAPLSGKPSKPGAEMKAGLSWDSLPVTVKDLYLLGFVDFRQGKGRLRGIRLREGLGAAIAFWEGGEESLLQSGAPAKPLSLPNLESLLPLEADFFLRFLLEMTAERCNDESLTRYRFRKETLVAGLGGGISQGRFSSFMDLLGLPGSVAQTLKEWAESFFTATFTEPLLLRIRDPRRYDELAQIPEFLALTEESLPKFGFLIRRSAKSSVRDILFHFGLTPGEGPSKPPAGTAFVLTPSASFPLPPPPPDGEIQYGEREKALPDILPLRKSRDAARPALTQDAAEKLRILEEVLSQGRSVEFSYGDNAPKKMVAKPILLIKHREPMKFIAIEGESGHRNEYLLDKARELQPAE